MSHVDIGKLQDLFDRLIERDAPARAELLAEIGASDPGLREELSSLLAAHERAGDVLRRFEELPGPNAPAGDDREVAPAGLPSRYRFLREIDRGGMGVVYLAEDLRLNRRVALKFLPPARAGAESSRARLIREARAVAALDHPNVATLFDADSTEDGGLFLSMAYYEGRTLRRLLGGEPLEPLQAVQFALQAACGLAAAHERNVIHRDLKPENIFVTTDGVVKILDFGLAAVAGVDEAASALGTPAYAAPEQLRGEPPDFQTDLWALGVMLFEMLSGERPPRLAAESSERADAAAAGVPLPVIPGPPEVISRLHSLLAGMLEADPSRRLRDAGEAAQELEGIARGLEGRGEEQGPARPPNNLPARLTSFVGREEVLPAARGLLAEHRLVTLTGTPGTGKTTLALRIAEEALPEFPHGVYFVGLAGIDDPGLVPSEIARALGVREQGDAPLVDTLVRFLRDRIVLLVADNFEHVLDAAPVIPALLEGCPGLRILVTSRAPLRVAGEQEFNVPPLQVPAGAKQTVSSLRRNESIRLFLQRAQAVRQDFDLTAGNAPILAEVCARLEGLPLAIELAAARVRLLTPRALLSRLDRRLELLSGGRADAPARHRALREAIRWSYDLLDADEQRLLQVLAVFSGGASLDAVESVCRRLELTGQPLIDMLETLVASNLVRQEEGQDGTPRFRLLEMIREYGLERLAESGAGTQVRSEHAAYFLALSEQADPHCFPDDGETWLDRLDRDHDNLRTAFEWCIGDEGRRPPAVRFGLALRRFWLIRGYVKEGRDRLHRLIAVTDAKRHPEWRAQLLAGAGTMAHNLGDYPGAKAVFEEALGLFRTLDDRRGVAECLNHLGWALWRLAEYHDAERLSNEALSLHRQMSDRAGVAHSLNNVSWIAAYRGELHKASTLQEEVLAMRRELGEKRGIAFALTNLGWIRSWMGRFEDAAGHLEEARSLYREIGEKQLLAFAAVCLAQAELGSGEAARASERVERECMALFERVGDRWGLGVSFGVLGGASEAAGRFEEALRHHGRSLEIRRETGERWGIGWSLNEIAEVLLMLSDAEKARPLHSESLALRWRIGDRAGLARCFETCSMMAFADRDPEQAALLFGAAERLRRETGRARALYLRERYARLERDLRALLPADRFELLREKGARLPLQDAARAAGLPDHAPDGR